MSLRSLVSDVRPCLDDDFPVSQITVENSIAEHSREQIGDSNFDLVAAGRTWQQVAFDQVRLVDFLNGLSSYGIVALTPALLIGSLYTEDADVFLNSFPRFLRSLVSRGLLNIFSERQFRCICLVLSLIRDNATDGLDREVYDGFIGVYDEVFAVLCASDWKAVLAVESQVQGLFPGELGKVEEGLHGEAERRIFHAVTRAGR